MKNIALAALLGLLSFSAQAQPVVGSGPTAHQYNSPDGGTTWTPQPPPTGSGTAAPTYALPSSPGGPAYSQSNPGPTTLVDPNFTIQPGVTATGTLAQITGANYAGGEAMLWVNTQGNGTMVVSAEYSGDNITWVTPTATAPALCQRLSDGNRTNQINPGAAGAAYFCPMPTPYFRFQITTANSVTNPWVFATAFRHSQVASTSTAAAPTPLSVNGCGNATNVIINTTTNAGVVSASATNRLLCAVSASVPSTGTSCSIWVRLFQTNTTPNPNTTAPYIGPFLVNIGHETVIPVGPFGASFTNGIGYAVTGAGASTDNTSVATSCAGGDLTLIWQ